ncbi:PTS lactose transporter subunit IIB [Lentilactobacillus buchneri]|nr:PTS lactose transporter subunit IIB [Lentilactobacillus sp. Egmn17]
MKKVLLICESGISSNFLAKSARPFIELYDAKIELIPTNINNADTYLGDPIDLVLVAPQASYHKKELATQIKTIPDEIYGWANGEKLVKFIMAQLSPIGAA